MYRVGLAAIVLLGAAACSPVNDRGLTVVPLVAKPARSVDSLEHCRPAADAEAMLRAHGFEKQSTFVRFETWAHRTGHRLVMGRLDGHLCVLGPELAGDVT